MAWMATSCTCGKFSKNEIEKKNLFCFGAWDCTHSRFLMLSFLSPWLIGPLLFMLAHACFGQTGDMDMNKYVWLLTRLFFVVIIINSPTIFVNVKKSGGSGFNGKKWEKATTNAIENENGSCRKSEREIEKRERACEWSLNRRWNEKTTLSTFIVFELKYCQKIWLFCRIY